MGAWFVDKLLPGLLLQIPFILIVGLGWQRHKRVLDRSNQRANDRQTAELKTFIKQKEGADGQDGQAPVEAAPVGEFARRAGRQPDEGRAGR